MNHHPTVGKALPRQLTAYQRHQEGDLLQAQEYYELHDTRQRSYQRCFQSWLTDQTLIPGLNSWFWSLRLSSLAGCLRLLQFCYFPVPNSSWWRYFLQPELLPHPIAATCNFSNIKNISLWLWPFSSFLDYIPYDVLSSYLCSLSSWSLQINPRAGCPLPDHNSNLA